MPAHRPAWSRILGAAILCCSLIHHAQAATQTVSTTEQRIQRIQGAILPVVVVKGEPGQTTSLADRMAALHVPGVSIAIIHEGKIEWARGFGVARIDGPAVTPDTLFQAASISKPISALAVLRLVQAGKLNLDTDVNQYLKGWKLPANPFTAQTPVTLRLLLTHTAGVTVHGFAGYAAGEQVPTTLQVLDGQPPANSPPIRVDLAPGKTWRYSGGGYVITQQLLVDQTGQPFDKVMQETVLKPLGMTHSTYAQPLPQKLLAMAATPYLLQGAPVKGGAHVYPEMAPAGLWTTPSDLARYAIEVQQSLAGKSTRLLSAATTRMMLTPGLNNHGLGPLTGGSEPRRYFGHNGANAGFRCGLIAYADGEGAAIMTNGDNGGQLVAELIRTIAHEYGWPDFQPPEYSVAAVNPQVFDSYVGSYQLGPAVFLNVTREGNRLFAQNSGQAKLQLLPMSERTFFIKEAEVRFSFQPGNDGNVSSVSVHQPEGRDSTARRLDDAQGKAIADVMAADNKRFASQTPAPGGEAALLQFIKEMAAGTPNYQNLSPPLANTVRLQLALLQSDFSKKGAVRATTFKSVGAGGNDFYIVDFEHGVGEFRIRVQGERIDFLSVNFPEQ